MYSLQTYRTIHFCPKNFILSHSPSSSTCIEGATTFFALKTYLACIYSVLVQTFSSQELKKYIPVDIFGKCGSKKHKCPRDGDQCFRDKEYPAGVTEAYLSSSHNAFSLILYRNSCDFSRGMTTKLKTQFIFTTVAQKIPPGEGTRFEFDNYVTAGRRTDNLLQLCQPQL